MFELLLYFTKNIGLYNSTYLLITFLGVLVTAFGIMMTGIFSFLLWRATKETNSLSKANFELSKTLVEYQRSKEEGMRNQYRNQLWKKLQRLVYALMRQLNPKFDYLEIIKTHQNFNEHGLSDETLGFYFSEEERFLIGEVWSHFDAYVKTYWMQDGDYIKNNYRSNREVIIENTRHCLSLSNQLDKLLFEND